MPRARTQRACARAGDEPARELWADTGLRDLDDELRRDRLARRKAASGGSASACMQAPVDASTQRLRVELQPVVAQCLQKALLDSSITRGGVVHLRRNISSVRRCAGLSCSASRAPGSSVSASRPPSGTGRRRQTGVRRYSRPRIGNAASNRRSRRHGKRDMRRVGSAGSTTTSAPPAPR